MKLYAFYHAYPCDARGTKMKVTGRAVVDTERVLGYSEIVEQATAAVRQEIPSLRSTPLHFYSFSLENQEVAL